MSSHNNHQHVRHRDDLDDDDTLGLMFTTAGSGPKHQRGYGSSSFASRATSRLKNCLVCSMCCCGIIVIFATSLVTILYFSLLFAFPIRDPDLQWNWKQINTSDIYFPPNFLFGTATAAHQVEGYNYNNNWFLFENQTNPSTGQCMIDNCQHAGKADNHWNLYASDITLLMKQELGVNSYRFSIEWSKIEPEQGVINRTAVDHYHSVIDLLLQQGIEPMVTLHHFTEPIWVYNMGSFANESNIPHFVKFSEFVYREYGSKVTKWCTINEPNVYSFMGYAMGAFPPAKRDNELAARVLLNLAKAHVAVYKAIKTIDTRNTSRIGIVLNVQQFEPFNYWNPLDRLIATLMNNVYNNAILGFFHTGVYKCYQPGVMLVEYTDNTAPSTNDFFGVNYYTHEYIKFQMDLNYPFATVVPYSNDDDENEKIKLTDMGQIIYPEGIYRAIKMVSKLNLPIIITENGLADAKDTMRDQFTRRYLYAVSKAIADGYNVVGYYYWSLMDNFEWARGFDMRFGLFSVDYTSESRTLRNGAKYFASVVKKFTKKSA